MLRYVVRHKFQTNSFNSILLPLPMYQLCSNGRWLLLKWSEIGLGFDGAKTICKTAHILYILLIINYSFYFRSIRTICKLEFQ